MLPPREGTADNPFWLPACRHLPVAGTQGRFYHAPAHGARVVARRSSEVGGGTTPAACAGCARRTTENRKDMLQSLRKSAGSFVIKILFGLLVLSFAVWGIGDSFFGAGGGNIVAEVGGREITVRELDEAFRNEMERLRRFNIDEQQARQLGVLDQVLERLIAIALVEEAAKDMGMVVGTAVIQEQIRNQLGQNITPSELQSRLRNAGLSEAQFVGQLRRQIVNANYQGTLAGGTKAPEVLVDSLYQWRGEKRSVSMMTLPVNPTSVVPEPTTEQLKTYYEAHPGDYTAPEYRTLSYVFLNPKAAAAKVTVADERLREVYEQRRDQYVVPEKRTVLQMLVSDRATADKAIDRLRKGDKFVTVAKELADQDESATRLGTVTRDELPNGIADAVFGLAKDKISEPVQGPFGLQILKVTEIEPGKTPSFDEIRPELALEVAQEEAIDSILGMTNRIEESLGSGASLSEAAQELGLQLRKIASVDREGVDKQDRPVPDIPTAPFLQIAFETGAGQDSLLHETDDNGFFVLHIDSIQPAALRPLDTVRDEVIDDWKSEQRWKQAREEAKKIVERLNNGAKIADIAADLKLEATDTDGITRSGEGAPANMPSSLVADIFAGKAPGHASFADGLGGINIAQLKAITAATPAKDKQSVEQLRKSLDFGITNDISTQLVNALRERYGVTVNQAAIQTNFFRNASDS